MADALNSSPAVEGGAVPACKPWGFWASLAWLALVLALWMWGFNKLEHALLHGTAFGALINRSFALGALKLLISFSVPLLVLVTAVRIRRCSVRDYLGWVGPRGQNVLLGIVLALALQFLIYAVLYLMGADITGAAVAQWRAETATGTPHWWPLLLAWPSIFCAPFVEECVFRGFLWRGWAESPLGGTGTWLLTTLAFVAFHIPAAMERDSINAGVMLVTVLLFGLFLGWLRWRTGTTTAPIIAHIILNLIPPLFAFAAGAMFAGPTSTFMPTNSAACFRISSTVSAQRNSMTMFVPST